MNCFQHIPESRGALHNPSGEHHDDFTPTPTLPGALHHRARPYLSFLVSDHTRVSHAQARPLNPAALAFVPYRIVLVRVRVRENTNNRQLRLVKSCHSTFRPDKTTTTNFQPISLVLNHRQARSRQEDTGTSVACPASSLTSQSIAARVAFHRIRQSSPSSVPS